MEKLGCVIGIIVFLFVTALVVFTDAGTVNYTVTFSKQNLAVNSQEETSTAPANTPGKGTSAKISNKNISSANVNFDIETKELYNSGVDYRNQDIKYNNQNVTNRNMSINNSGFTNVNNSVKNYSSVNNNTARIYNSGNLDNRGGVYGLGGKMNNQGVNTQALNVKQSEINKLKAGLTPSNNYLSKNIKYNNNQSVNQYSPDFNRDNYELKNIDWNVWRSNFVNRITDDTFYIPELDNYPTGTLFHYSFTVDDTGRVYNVRVSSLTISRSDREKIADLIRGYSYKEITRFPAGSKRKSTNVSAILIFSKETEYSSPSDFHDLEQLKMKL